MLFAKDKRFFVARLKNASISELIYRSKEKLLIWRLKRKYAYHNQKTIIITKSISFNKLSLPSFQNKTTKKNIEELLAGKIFALNCDQSTLKWVEQEFGNAFFSLINWREGRYDIRAIWEPARLQNITTLLAFVNANPDGRISAKVKQFCLNEVLNWIQRNRFLCGPHYISAMECSLRIPVLFYSLMLLDNLNSNQIRLILETIYLHAWWISKRLSLYSSTGNHTIAESVGLIFAGALFGDLKEARKWLVKGISILRRELSHQILEDGGPAEQSFHYHRFILDLYWLAIGFLEINKLYNCQNLKPQLSRAENFLSAFQLSDREIPSIGDSDDGFAIAPFIAPDRPKYTQEQRDIRTYKNSGYTVINTQNMTQVIFDHGPLGMPPLYNHGHADALSIILYKNGEQILVDPGTYKYNGEPDWRRYFKGTRSHNTVTIDGRDQSVQETGFIWSHPYQVKFLRFSEHDRYFLISAEHDGYAQLEEPVWHRRDILFFDDCYFLIKDSFKGKGLHDFEINFHLHPDVDLIKKNSWWQINNNGARIYMRMLENGDFSIIGGSKDPIHGWYSPHYGAKLKCNVMSCKQNGFPHEITFVTVICTEALIDKKKIQDKLIYFD